MVDPQIRVGIDVGCKAHRVGIAPCLGSLRTARPGSVELPGVPSSETLLWIPAP